ncbi:MAG: carbohydrate-binding protein, partial [Planctomycetota bacterium]
FAEAGVFTVELVVTDKQGAKRVATVPVVVGNERPRVRFVEPAPGDFLDPDQPIQYRLIVSDAEDGTNDFQLVDSQGLEELQPRDVDRVTVNAVYATGPIPAPDGGVADNAAPLGLRRLKRSDCFNCHAVDAPRVGPPLIEIANKYRGQNGALEASVQRVLKGSTGVWGKIPMIPHSQHTADEVRDMVSWIYSLEPAGLVRVFRGFVGEIPVAADDLKKPGYYRLEATYLDRGAGDIPALTGSATIVLRQRRIEAETADEVRGPRVLPAATASGGKFMGAIDHGHTLTFRQIPMSKVRRISVALASAGAGGAVELRLDKPDGKLLATVPVEVNGQWEKFYERSVELPETQGVHDVIVRFTHPGGASGLMKWDWIQFQR